MNDFLTWETLLSYTNFISIVYMVVEFTKEIKFIKRIPTRYWSFFVSFYLLISVHFSLNSFVFKDIVLYLLTSVVVSLSSNGISNFNFNKNSNEKHKNNYVFIF